MGISRQPRFVLRIDLVKRGRASMLLTQSEFAALAGISRHTYSEVERGRYLDSPVRLRTLRGIAAALGVDPMSIVKEVLPGGDDDDDALD